MASLTLPNLSSIIREPLKTQSGFLEVLINQYCPIIGDFCLKFKYLVIVFNIIILFFLIVIALMPMLLMGSGFTVNSWKTAWPIALVLVLALGGLNVFFLLNYKLLILLEREDWPALAYYLEQKVFGKGQYTSRKVRLLANSYLIMSDFASILQLESKTTAARPAIIRKNALIFGAARLISGDQQGAAAFFQSCLEKGKVEEEQWVRWFYGFSRTLAGDFGQAEMEFTTLAASSRDALITGLSAYFLGNILAKHSLNPDECRSISENGRARVRKTFKNMEGWKKEAEKAGSEVHTAIIRKYINEAGPWLFG